MSLHLFERVPGGLRTPITTDQLGEIPGGARIRCPKCGWEPSAGDTWACECGHAWNTFDTRGTCPACQRMYAETQCPSCGEWSLHEDWYT
jgi:hypothetical protein